MLGRFLEISVHAPDILDSIGFWERLGFRQAVTNDVWRHPYALLTDGVLPLGLHRYEFDSPALTYVRQDLKSHLPALRAAGVEFAFAKVGDDEFHEAGFTSPDGQMIALLETRTYSPPSFDEPPRTLLGEFDALVLPVRRVDRTLPFFAKLGAAVLEYDEDTPDRALLAYGPLRLRLTEDASVKAAALRFRVPDLDACTEAVNRAVGEAEPLGPKGIRLTSPEGLIVRVDEEM